MRDPIVPLVGPDRLSVHRGFRVIEGDDRNRTGGPFRSSERRECTGFQDRCIQPLCHPSGREDERSETPETLWLRAISLLDRLIRSPERCSGLRPYAGASGHEKWEDSPLTIPGGMMNDRQEQSDQSVSVSSQSIGRPDCSHTATAIEARLVRAMEENGQIVPRGFIVMEHNRGKTAAHLTAKEADFLSRKLRKLANDLSAAEARSSS